MNMNGGYEMIDASKFNYTNSTGYVVEGIYKKYFNAIKNNKVLVNNNITNSSPETTTATINTSTGVISASVGNNAFTIATNDTITNS